MIGDTPDVQLPGGVRRALEAMRCNPERNWTVAGLAAVAGLSGRTLQRQFRTFLGKSPRCLLRDIRFACARRQLLQAPGETRVMDVAMNCGLPHFGRFSIEYQRRFGEAPSRTLKRQAVFASTLPSWPVHFAPGRNRPTIALLPIEAAPADDETARGITEELTTALGRAGFAIANHARPARYQLRGSLRGHAKQSSLTLRLIDTEAGRHLWAHRADGISSVPDEQLATRIAAALQPVLRLSEIDRARQKPDSDLDPHDLALRAMPGVLALDAGGNIHALELLERAMDRDPKHGLATALASWAHAQRIVYHFSHDPVADRARGLELARKGQALAEDSTVLAVLGNALTLLNELDAAEAVTRRALSLDGGSAWAWSRSGWIDLYKGNAPSAIERLTIALDLAPQDPLAFNSMVGIGCAHFTVGRYRNAAHWQLRALAEHPSAVWVHRTLCPALALGGAAPEASRSLSALRQHYPDLTLPELRLGMPPLPPESRDLIVEALQTAGLPG